MGVGSILKNANFDKNLREIFQLETNNRKKHLQQCIKRSGPKVFFGPLRFMTYNFN
jgi:hypothetical protein